MLNTVTLVGRLVSDPEKKGTKGMITLAVSRTFKNKNGEYEIDFIPCLLFGKISKPTFEYCKKGDIVGVKGRIENTSGELHIVAEKVTLLSNKKEK